MRPAGRTRRQAWLARRCGSRSRRSRWRHRRAAAPRPSGLPSTDTPSASTFAALASAAIVAVCVLPFIVVRARGGDCDLADAGDRRARARGQVVLRRWIRAARARRATASEPIVIGTELTPLGATYRQANPSLSNDELLFDAAGVPERIWTRRSIDRCRTFISTTYFLEFRSSWCACSRPSR